MHTRTTPLQIRMAVLEQFMHPQRICATSLRVSLTQLMRLTSLSPTVYVLRLSLILCGERMQPPPLHPHTCARASCRSVQMLTHTQSICLSSVWCVHTPYTCRVFDIHHTHAEYVTHLPVFCEGLGHGTCTTAAANAKIRGAKQPWTCGRAGARKRERALDRERARKLHGEREREECCARVGACVLGVFWGVCMCVRVHLMSSRF